MSAPLKLPFMYREANRVRRERARRLSPRPEPQPALITMTPSEHEAELIKDIDRALELAFIGAQDARKHDLAAVLDQAMCASEHDHRRLADLGRQARAWNADLKKYLRRKRRSGGLPVPELNAPMTRETALRVTHWNLHSTLDRPKPASWRTIARTFRRAAESMPELLTGIVDAVLSESALTAALARKYADTKPTAREVLRQCVRLCGCKYELIKTATRRLPNV